MDTALRQFLRTSPYQLANIFSTSNSPPSLRIRHEELGGDPLPQDIIGKHWQQSAAHPGKNRPSCRTSHAISAKIRVLCMAGVYAGVQESCQPLLYFQMRKMPHGAMPIRQDLRISTIVCLLFQQLNSFLICFNLDYSKSYIQFMK